MKAYRKWLKKGIFLNAGYVSGEYGTQDKQGMFDST